MWSLFACEGVGVVAVEVGSGTVFGGLGCGALGIGRVSCGTGRDSVELGVGASVTLGSTEANLGVVNGSEGCMGGVSSDPKRPHVQDQHDEAFNELALKNPPVELVDRALSVLDLDSSSTTSWVPAFCPLRPSAIINL